MKKDIKMLGLYFKVIEMLTDIQLIANLCLHLLAILQKIHTDRAFFVNEIAVTVAVHLYISTRSKVCFFKLQWK